MPKQTNGSPSTPLIIEVAINGATPKSRFAHTPRSAKEITDDTFACLDAGATIIHTHNSDISLTGQLAADDYLRAWNPVWAQRPSTMLYATIAFVDGFENRFGHYRPLAEAGMVMGALDPGSVNLASHGVDGLPGEFSMVYETSHKDIAQLVALMNEERLGPSIAVYEPGYLRTVLAYHRAGRLPAGAFIKLYFGGDYNLIDGQRSDVTFGLPPTQKALDAYLEMLEGSNLPWAVAVLGGCVVETGLARRAIEHGGHVRVGLEDYAGPGQPSNPELVKQIIDIANDLARPIADETQTRTILALPR